MRTPNSSEYETQDERTRQKRIIVVDVPLIIPRRQCAFGTFDSVYSYVRWCDHLISASLNMRARVLAIYLFHFDSVSRNWVFGNAANDKANFVRHNKNHVLFIVTLNSSDGITDGLKVSFGRNSWLTVFSSSRRFGNFISCSVFFILFYFINFYCLFRFSTYKLGFLFNTR